MTPEQITAQRQHASLLRALPDHELVQVLLLIEWAAVRAGNARQSDPAKRLLRLLAELPKEQAP